MSIHTPPTPTPLITWATASADDKIAAISALEGHTFAEVAAALDVQPAALHGFIFRNRTRVKRPPAKFTVWHQLGTAEARAARVRELDDAGVTTREIAALLGISAGWIVRVMTKRREPVINGGPMPRPEPAEPRFPVHPLPPAETWAPTRPPLSMGELNDDTCRWPIEVDGVPAGYCGGHVHRRGYCEHHYNVAYRPATVVRAPVDHAGVGMVKPLASRIAMRMTGAAARKVELVE